MRKVQFGNGEYYHIFNRGVDKRKIFEDQYDFERFFQSMNEFNALDPIGSIYENSFKKNDEQLGHRMSKLKPAKLVDFTCYCLNPNHYHFVLQQLVDKGVEKFMQRIGNGYTKYFNNKYKRSGVLFQGKYRAVHVNSNEQLLHVSAYVNLNDRVHQLGHSMSKSSWGEYVGSGNGNNEKGFCEKGVILGQFDNSGEYKDFAESSLGDILEKREEREFLLE